MMRTFAIATALFLSLLLSPFAFAADGSTYFYGGLPKDEARRILQEELGRTVSDAELRSIPNVELPVADDLWILGAQETFPCLPAVADKMREIAGGTDVSFGLLLEAAEAELDALDQEGAHELLDLLADGIACASQELTREELARTFFLLGVNEAFKTPPDLSVARGSFRQAVQMGGRPEWDDTYSPSLQDLYLQATAEAESYGRMDLAYRLSGLELERFQVDGDPVELSENHRGLLRILPGRHVIQWRKAGGELKTRVLEAEKALSVVSAEGLRQVLSGRPDTSDPAWLVQETFLKRQGTEASVLVADPSTGEVEFLYTYDGRGEETFDSRGEKTSAVRWRVGAPKDLTIRQVEVRYKPVEFRLGGGYVHGPAFAVAVTADFWLLRGLGIEFGADAGFTVARLGLASEDTRLVVLPSVRFGTRVELRPERLVKPYATLLARVLFGADPPALAGPFGIIGCTFMVRGEDARQQAVGFWIEAGGGPQFSAGQPVRGTFVVLAGLTLRPYTLK